MSCIHVCATQHAVGIDSRWHALKACHTGSHTNCRCTALLSCMRLSMWRRWLVVYFRLAYRWYSSGVVRHTCTQPTKKRLRAQLQMRLCRIQRMKKRVHVGAEFVF